MAIIAGTSCCHMLLLENEHFVNGVWGPYKNAVLKNMHLLEGGQTSAGSTLDWLVTLTGKSIDNLESQFDGLANNVEKTGVTVIADFHGNRSPLANPAIKGSITGLSIGTELKEIYLATMQGLALGTRHIIDAIQNKCDLKIDELVITGGLSKSSLFNQINANANQIPVVIPDTENGVLLGSAMLGAVAAGTFSDLKSAQKAMSQKGCSIQPNLKMSDFYAEKAERHFKLLTANL